ncbi:hypothetical protein MN0502_35090 (plasmid) [Arthrobacter sp. MN05-02]|nr:hypothetical protein MN0502_35090 [Arthrobacter sp. MN05-02]
MRSWPGNPNPPSKVGPASPASIRTGPPTGFFTAWAYQYSAIATEHRIPHTALKPHTALHARLSKCLL